MILLSLCVPTYNRARFLEESLPAILSSIPPEDHPEVELVISDNASTDDTQSVIAAYRHQYPHLNWTVIRQESNIGPSNVTVVTQYAQGEFVWILSDDDIVLPGATEHILSRIRSQSDLNGIIANYAPFKNDIRYLKLPVLPQTTTPQTPDEWLGFLSSQLTFISILVYRRSLTQLPAQHRLLSSLCQCYMFLDVIRRGHIAYLPQAVLAVRGNNSGGYGFFQVFVGEFEQVLVYANELGFSQDSIRQARDRHMPFLLSFAVGSRLNSVQGKFKPDLRGDVQLILKYYPYRLIPTLTIGVLSLPAFVFGFLSGLLRLFRSQNA